MKLYVTRHGETDYNEKRLVCGQIEATLTDKGIAQAKSLAAYLQDNKDLFAIKRIISSPLSRARITASFAETALGLKATYDPRLMEMSFGSMEGVPWEDPEFGRIKINPFSRFPNGESALDVSHRVFSLLDELKEQEKEGNVLLCCHGTLARILSCYFISYTREEYAAIRWGNCELKAFDL